MTPENEITWVSNVRKSIASAFKIPFFLSSPSSSIMSVMENRIISQKDASNSFRRHEESIHGTCMHTYVNHSFTHIWIFVDPQLTSVQLKHKYLPYTCVHKRHHRRYTLTKSAPVPSMRPPMEADAGDARRSVFRLVKSIDFFDCPDRVIYWKSCESWISFILQQPARYKPH